MDRPYEGERFREEVVPDGAEYHEIMRPKLMDREVDLPPAIWEGRIGDLVHELTDLHKRLRRCGAWLVRCASTGLIVTVMMLLYTALAALLSSPGLETRHEQVMILIALGVLSCTAMLTVSVAVWFDRIRREGDVVYAELSDAAQGLHAIKHVDEMEDAIREIRLALRRFDTVTDAPLVPGRAGPAVYVLVNLLMLAFAWWFAFAAGLVRAL
jgi:hypothetical protein